MWCFKPGQTRGGETNQAHTEDTDGGGDDWLACSRCEYRLTSDQDRTTVNERHEHTFMNPHAFAYHIGCFGNAPGAAGYGAATTEFTWFPGYAWQLAHCRGCGVHLGWKFQADSHSFFGLVLDRLVRRSE